MPNSVASLRNKKLRRLVLGSVSLLTVFVAGGLALSVYARISDAYDHAH